MPHARHTTIIKASPERVFSVITNPQRIQPLIPGLLEVRDVTLPLVPGSHFAWAFQLLGLTFRGDWKVQELRPPYFYSSHTTGGMQSSWTYTLVPEKVATVLTLDIDYTLPDSLVTRYALQLMEPHIVSLMETYLTSLQSFVELQHNDPRAS